MLRPFRVILDRGGRTIVPMYVRFAPKATLGHQDANPSRSAKSRHRAGDLNEILLAPPRPASYPVR
jgi:hypothetical protein